MYMLQKLPYNFKETLNFFFKISGVYTLFTALYWWNKSKMYMLQKLPYNFKETLNFFFKISGVTCVECRFWYGV